MRWRWGVGGLVVGVLAVAIAWRACVNSRKTSLGTAPTTRRAVASPKSHSLGPPRASIAGTVRDDAGAPLDHARVCARVEASGLPRDVEVEIHCTDTDGAGHFELVDVYPTELVVCAMADHRRPAQRGPLTLAAGEKRTDVDLVLLGGGVEVSGTVSDLGGGAIVHAHVTSYSMSTYSASPIVDTNEAGEFRLWVSPGPIDVSVAADGYTHAFEAGVAPGTFEIVLTPESTISGTVVDGATRLPIPGAAVTLFESIDTDYGYHGGVDTEADEQGRFYFDRLNAGRYYAEATAPHGFGRSNGSIAVAYGQHAEGLVVETRPAVRLEGKVIYDAGAKPCSRPQLSVSNGDTTRTTFGETDGAVRSGGLRPGTYQAGVSCPDYPTATNAQKVVIADADLTGLTWRLSLSVTNAAIRGHIRSRSGDAVPGVTISVDRHQTSSMADGSYSLGHLEAAPIDVLVDSERGFGPANPIHVTLVAGETTVQDIVLDPAGSIAGSVVDTTGTPVPGVRVAITYPDYYRTISDSTGHFRLGKVRPGSFSIDAEQADGAFVKERVTVRGNETSTLQFVVATAAGSISGSVVDEAGSPIGDAFVIAVREINGYADVHPSWPTEEPKVATASDGTFTVSHLVAGTYAVRAYRSGAGEATAANLPVGSHTRLQILSTGSIAGTVHSSGGTLEEVTLRVVEVNSGLSRREKFYRTEGQYHLDDLPAGDYRITAEADDTQAQATTKLVPGAHVTGIDVTLLAPITVTGRIVDFDTKQPLAGVGVSAGFEDRRRRDYAETAADGHFALKEVPHGLVGFRLAAPRDAGYPDVYFDREISTGGSLDLGDLTLVKLRNPANTARGRLGIYFVNHTLRIERIAAGGPAARSALVVGDLITAINGVDVTDLEGDAGLELLNSMPGTAFRLGLARAITVTLVSVAEPP